jgi:hypothetical protein
MVKPSFESTSRKLLSIFFSFCRRAASWGLLQMAGSVSLASISLICSDFWAISKKPPKVGGFLLQFGEQAFQLNEFHGPIVAGLAGLVKGPAAGVVGRLPLFSQNRILSFCQSSLRLSLPLFDE